MFLVSGIKTLYELVDSNGNFLHLFKPRVGPTTMLSSFNFTLLKQTSIPSQSNDGVILPLHKFQQTYLKFINNLFNMRRATRGGSAIRKLNQS